MIFLLFILGVTAFFTIPLLELKNATTYEVFVKDRMGTVESYNESKIEILRLIYTGNELLSFELGIVTIVGVFLTPLSIKKIDKSYKKEYILFLILGIFSTLMTLRIIPINIIGNFASMIQFAWRFLEFSAFFFSIIAAINLVTCIVNFKILDVLVIIAIIILSLFTLIKHLEYEQPISEKQLLESVPVTENTGRVHAGCASFEYLPQKAFKNLDYIKTRKNEIYTLFGKTKIEDYEKNDIKLKCTIEAEENVKLELPYIYYPGYAVTLQTETQKYNIETYETENGFVGIDISEGTKGELEVIYTGTKLMLIAKIISIISIIVLVMKQFDRQKSPEILSKKVKK